MKLAGRSDVMATHTAPILFCLGVVLFVVFGVQAGLASDVAARCIYAVVSVVWLGMAIVYGFIYRTRMH